VHLADGVAFLAEQLEKKVSKQTVNTTLRNLGFSYRKCKTNNGGYRLSKKQQQFLIIDWLNKRTDDGFFNTRRNMVGSMDFTFTSHKTHSRHSFAKAGG